MEVCNIGSAPSGLKWPARVDLLNIVCGACLISLLATLLFISPSVAATLQGRVIAVSDGDTVKVLDQSNTEWKIRLMGIDAPEKRQAFGNSSKSNLSDLVFGKPVTVEYSKKDKYGRTVGKIRVNGIDANLEQVKAGLAWHYKKYEKEQSEEDRDTYAREEDQARTRQRGLWRDAAPEPPWDWRKAKKRKAKLILDGSDRQPSP